MPIAVSLQAGFMEECLFRAVPLALGALIGARFGAPQGRHRHRVRAAGRDLRRRARELPGLSVVFAPGRARAAVDALGRDLPALRIAADDPAARAVRSHAVLDPAVPGRRARRRTAARGGDRCRRSCRSASCCGGGPRRARGANCRARCATAPGRRAPRCRRRVRRTRRVVAASRGQDLVQRSLPYARTRGPGRVVRVHADARGRASRWRSIARAAEAAADAALKARGVVLGPEWRRLLDGARRAATSAQWTQHKFVWREAGASVYRALIGTTLAPPLWDVRYAMFEGDVAARAEEWRVTIEPDGAVRQVRHVLPEARPGARLAEGRRPRAGRAARARALRRRSRRAASSSRADERDRPARTDWSFVFSDPRVDVGKDGEARMVVTLAGDESRRRGPFRPRARVLAARRARALRARADREDGRRPRVRARGARGARRRRAELDARPLRHPRARASSSRWCSRPPPRASPSRGHRSRCS